MLFDHKRSEVEIISNILSLTKNGAKKTHIMYKTNMSYSLFINYLDFLIDKKLIERQNSNPSGEVFYKVTEDGKKVLKNINTVLDYMK